MERIKTRSAIELSLNELMRKRPFDKITVSQICESSQISRQLFYYYYKDKYDVINQYYQRKADEVVNSCKGNLPWEQVLNGILLHMKEQEEYYISAFSSDGQNSFPVFLESYTYNMHRRLIEAQAGPEALSKQTRFSLEFYSHSAAYMATKWARKKMNEPTEYMAERLVSNLTGELKAFFV